MKKLALTGLLAAAVLSSPAQAFQQITHKRIAIDAVNYMKAHPTTTESVSYTHLTLPTSDLV